MALTTRLPSTKVEPFYGFVETTGDALRLIQAARQGIIPRITRRLNDLERRAMIRSGSIFIFSDEESGIKRWTEGLSWSASRIVGNFLIYREVSDRSNARTPPEGRRVPKRRANAPELSPAELAEQKLSKSLVGCLNDSHGRFKPNGLIKKTITINVEGSDHHLIAYYNQEDVRLGRLLPLSSRADIMALDIPPELLESTKFRIPPVIEDALDGRPRYICDADEEEISHSAPLPFPSLSESLRFSHILERVSPVLERPAQIMMVHSDYSSPTTPINSTKMESSQYPQSSLSPSSIASSTSLDSNLYWLNASSGTTHLSHTSQFFPTENQMEGPDIRPFFPFPTAEYLTYVSPGIHETTSLLPAWNSDIRMGSANNPIPFVPVPASSYIASAPDFDQTSSMLRSWTQTHLGQCTPLSYSSLPSTPTHPRKSQRFASLPSLLQSKDASSFPSTISSSPRSGDASCSLVSEQPLLSANDILNLSSTWS